MRLCEQGFDQISSHLPSECDLVSTVTELSCDKVNLKFSSCGCAELGTTRYCTVMIFFYFHFNAFLEELNGTFCARTR